jgi:NAD(P)-dependent dehydrogenase (short-subunit alcohol dehydrogenase family)
MGMPDPNITAAIARSTPVGRTRVPNDVAAACAWLTSEEAAWVTGQTIELNGGALTT